MPSFIICEKPPENEPKLKKDNAGVAKFRKRNRLRLYGILSLVGASPTARTMIKIRRFQPEDLDRALEIARDSLSWPWPKNEFEKYLEDSFAAEEDGRMIGLIVGKVLKNQGVIKLIAVEQNYRGKGIGKKLVEYLLNYFKENGARIVIARSRTGNENGISFLKNLGFGIVKTIEKYYLNGDDAYLMKKEL